MFSLPNGVEPKAASRLEGAGGREDLAEGDEGVGGGGEGCLGKATDAIAVSSSEASASSSHDSAGSAGFLPLVEMESLLREESRESVGGMIHDNDQSVDLIKTQLLFQARESLASIVEVGGCSGRRLHQLPSNYVSRQ